MPTSEVSGASNSGYHYERTYTLEAPSKELTTTDFMKLLAAQLRYQDMTNPMSNSEMMSTMTQMSSISAMNSMTQSVTNMTGATNDVLMVNMTSYATGMMGKEVTIALVDDDGKATGEKITGTVEGVSLFEGTPMVYVDGKGYQLSQFMSIGEVKDKEEDDDKVEGGQDNSGNESTEGNQNQEVSQA